MIMVVLGILITLIITYSPTTEKLQVWQIESFKRLGQNKKPAVYGPMIDIKPANCLSSIALICYV